MHILWCQVREIFLELLHDRGIIYWISIAKFEGKDSDDQILAHIGNPEAFPHSGHLLHQLGRLISNGIDVHGRKLAVRMFECHILAWTYSVVSWGSTSAIGEKICPWYFTTKSQSKEVTTKYDVQEGDTICSLIMQWSMREYVLRVSTYKL
jgi:hypothetical protein